MDRPVSQPAISVLISVYNGETYIKAAIDSLLVQSFRDFECLICDDGSRDATMAIIQSYTDPRIHVLVNPSNQGLSYSRNRLIDAARGRYIAWLDADDVSLPNRLEKQYRFLEAHPEYGLIGSWVQEIDAAGLLSPTIHRYGISAAELPFHLLLNNHFTQSAIMLRPSALPIPSYHNLLAVSEDYDLWSRIAQSCKVWNLPEVLVLYRVHGQNISLLKQEEIDRCDKEIQAARLQEKGLMLSEEELQAWFCLSRGVQALSEQQISALLTICSAIMARDLQTRKLAGSYFFQRIWTAIKRHKRYSLGTWRLLRDSDLWTYRNWSRWKEFTYYLRCLFAKK